MGSIGVSEQGGRGVKMREGWVKTISLFARLPDRVGVVFCFAIIIKSPPFSSPFHIGVFATSWRFFDV